MVEWKQTVRGEFFEINLLVQFFQTDVTSRLSNNLKSWGWKSRSPWYLIFIKINTISRNVNFTDEFLDGGVPKSADWVSILIIKMKSEEMFSQI